MQHNLLMLCCLSAFVGCGGYETFQHDKLAFQKQNGRNFCEAFENDEKISIHIDNHPYIDSCITIEFDANKNYDVISDSTQIKVISFGRKENIHYFTFEVKSQQCEGNILFLDENKNVIYSTTLFAYGTTLGTFINQTSQSLNKDKYEYYQLKKNLITQEEFDEYNAKQNQAFVTKNSKPKMTTYSGISIGPSRFYGMHI